jgi:hypothetical protein
MHTFMSLAEQLKDICRAEGMDRYGHKSHDHYKQKGTI